MNELVFLQDKQALTTSLKVAEYFNKRHDRVLRALENAIAKLPKNGDVEKSYVKTTYTDEKGESRPMYLMNRDMFSFVVMGFTGQKAAEFKWNYIQAFNAMEQKLMELMAERRSAEWLEARKLSKIEFRHLTDTIKALLIPQMEKEGASERAKRWVYKNYVSMIQKLLGIGKGTRNELPVDLMHELCKVQQMTVILIKNLVAAGSDYKKIYLDTKQEINSYAQISLFNQRFIAH